MVNYLARLGWSHGDDEIFSRAQFLAWFNLDHLGRSAAQFDEAKLKWVNAQHLKAMGDDALADSVKPFLAQRGITSTVTGLAVVLETHAVAATPPSITENILRGTRGIVRPIGRDVVTSPQFRLRWSWVVALLLLIGIGGLMWTNRGVDRNTPKTSMPLPAAHALRKLGRDIALARRKRDISTGDMAERPRFERPVGRGFTPGRGTPEVGGGSGR
jgi:hypothetical protein